MLPEYLSPNEIPNMGENMKKTISTMILISSLAMFTPSMPPVTADRLSSDTIELTELVRCPAGTFRVRRNTRTKKKLVHALIAGGIGAAIGGGVGGGRGALVGLGSGTGGYLVYRYVQDRRGRCVPRYVRG